MSEKKIKSLLSGLLGKKKGKKLIACTCAAAVVAASFPLISMTTSAQSTIEAKVTDYLNLRSGAGSNYSVVKVMDKNSRVTVLDRSNAQWIKVRMQDGTTGYCSQNFLDVVNDAATTTYVNFRKAAGTNADIIKTLSPNTKLDIITFAGSSWARASLSDGTKGYICTDYISYTSVTSSSTGNTTQAVSKPATQTSQNTASNTTTRTGSTNNVKLSVNARSVAVGNRFTITASGLQGTAQWSTTNGKVATVNSKGMVAGVSEGEATIIAKDLKTGASSACNVSVVKTDYNSITISETRKTLNEGQSFTLKAVSNPAGGKIYFRSDDTSIAKVTSKGVVTAVGAGKVWVTALDSTGVITSSCLLTVNSVGSLSISSSSLSVNAGSSVKLYATAMARS